ncbi:MAG: DUF1232 domain-containing protein [Gemmatimonadaceae bacterium]
MLVQLVEKTCAAIDGLNMEDALPGLQLQLRQSAPDAIANLRTEGVKHGGNPSENDAVMGAALLALVYVKGLPALARLMVQKMKDRRIDAARRCAVAGVLAYFVQPHDLIPDNAPGGYGWLDDAILLRAGLIEYLNLLPPGQTKVEFEQKVVGILVGLTPTHVRPSLQQAIGAMSLAVQVMGLMEGEIAEFVLAQVIANPLNTDPPVVPPGFRPHSVPSYDRGHWSAGMYFEGNSVVIPGGPSLIDGQLFIPT